MLGAYFFVLRGEGGGAFAAVLRACLCGSPSRGRGEKEEEEDGTFGKASEGERGGGGGGRENLLLGAATEEKKEEGASTFFDLGPTDRREGDPTAATVANAKEREREREREREFNASFLFLSPSLPAVSVCGVNLNKWVSLLLSTSPSRCDKGRRQIKERWVLLLWGRWAEKEEEEKDFLLAAPGKSTDRFSVAGSTLILLSKK